MANNIDKRSLDLTYEDKFMLSELYSAAQSLLQLQNCRPIKDFPLEFSGTTADLLYDHRVKNQALVLFIEAIVLDAKGKNDHEIITRLDLVKRITDNIKS